MKDQSFEVSIAEMSEHIYVKQNLSSSSHNKILVDTSDNMVIDLIHTDDKLRAYDMLSTYCEHQNPVFERMNKMFVKLRTRGWIPTLNKISTTDLTGSVHNIHIPVMTDNWEQKCNKNILYMFGEMFVEIAHAANPTLTWVYTCANIDSELMKEINHMFRYKEFRSSNKINLHAAQFYHEYNSY